MKILYTSGQVWNEIVKLFSSSIGRRGRKVAKQGVINNDIR